MEKSDVNVIDAGCENTLMEFASLVNLCKILITSDSLAMHIGIALKKKVICFFYSTSSSEIELYNRGIKIIGKGEDYCSYKPKCDIPPKWNIDDFIDGLMLVLDKGEHMNIYHIGTMEEMSIGAVAQEVGKYFGKEIEIVPGEKTKGGTPRRCPDIAKLKKLGYKPKIPFSEGLKITAKWYDENADKVRKIK